MSRRGTSPKYREDGLRLAAELGHGKRGFLRRRAALEQEWEDQAWEEGEEGEDEDEARGAGGHEAEEGEGSGGLSMSLQRVALLEMLDKEEMVVRSGERVGVVVWKGPMTPEVDATRAKAVRRVQRDVVDALVREGEQCDAELEEAFDRTAGLRDSCGLSCLDQEGVRASCLFLGSAGEGGVDLLIELTLGLWHFQESTVPLVGDPSSTFRPWNGEDEQDGERSEEGEGLVPPPLPSVGQGSRIVAVSGSSAEEPPGADDDR